jgi:hypothetical protein
MAVRLVVEGSSERRREKSRWKGKIHFGTEDLDLLFFPFDSEVLKKIDEIDMLREDSLCGGVEEKISLR